MKTIKMALMAIVTIFCVTTVNAQTKKSSKSTHKHTMAYQCPMKCEGAKTYSKAGKCPKCNMDLKAVAKEHATAVAYECPMKCEQGKTYDKAGKCPVCGMDLKALKTKKTEKETDMKM